MWCLLVKELRLGCLVINCHNLLRITFQNMETNLEILIIWRTFPLIMINQAMTMWLKYTCTAIFKLRHIPLFIFNLTCLSKCLIQMEHGEVPKTFIYKTSHCTMWQAILKPQLKTMITIYKSSSCFNFYAKPLLVWTQLKTMITIYKSSSCFNFYVKPLLVGPQLKTMITIYKSSSCFNFYVKPLLVHGYPTLIDSYLHTCMSHN